MEHHYDETLVGALALVVFLVTLAIAVGPWDSPYRLASVSAVQIRFGKLAARCIWVLIALASLASGLAILNGVRPSYAAPARNAQHAR